MVDQSLSVQRQGHRQHRLHFFGGASRGLLIGLLSPAECDDRLRFDLFTHVTTLPAITLNSDHTNGLSPRPNDPAPRIPEWYPVVERGVELT